jgi:Zn-dependent peptidase ImmA (M78 family)
VSQQSIVHDLMAGDRTRAESGPHLSAEFLRDTVAFAARYARLEKLLFGATKVSYSSSALSMNLSLAGDMIRQGEELAEAERARFGLKTGPILELGWLIEDQGVKIIPRVFPPDSPARGGFFFDSELGPCIVVDLAATATQRDHFLAHEYGHFIADFDPYITTICGRPTPETLADAAELRAHSFALAFSMPRADLEIYRKALGVTPPEISADFVRQLQVYFAVDYEMVFWRLLSLGWIDPPRIEVLLRDNPDLLEPVDVDRMDADERLTVLGHLPERFVHLVASAFGRDLLELEDAADYFGSDVETARTVLDQFHYEDEPARNAERAKRSGSRSIPPSLN